MQINCKTENTDNLLEIIVSERMNLRIEQEQKYSCRFSFRTLFSIYMSQAKFNLDKLICRSARNEEIIFLSFENKFKFSY